jgi:predicted nucleic acid-binding protein
VRTAIDTNVISALWSSEPLAGVVSDLLGDALSQGGLVICAPVHAELLAYPKASQEFVARFLADTSVAVDFILDEQVWREAGRRFSKYAERRRTAGGGAAKQLLVDFLVGARALLRADRLASLDGGRYENDFPELKVIACS